MRKVMRLWNGTYELDAYCLTDEAVEIRVRRLEAAHGWWTCWQCTIDDLDHLLVELKREAAEMSE